MTVNANFKRLARIIAVSSGFFFLAATGSSRPAWAQTPEKSRLIVKVVGVRNAKGKIGVALFQDAAGFPEDASKAIRQENVEIDREKLRSEIVFEDVPPGIYAISVRHDENMNGKLDKNFLGIPEEGYAASNNPGKKLRAPTFDEAKFSLNGTERTVEIKLIY
jgi:uncharacterized protein (DUF2141 family)